jgi:EAL and modified HD-GYP domain-containing signal transduction protein
MPREIESIAQAATMLGLDKIRNWASMLALCSLPAKPRFLCINSLVRSQMTLLLADAISTKETVPSDAMFSMSMISTMDAFLDLTIAEVVETLILAPKLRSAILQYDGTEGLLLQTAIAFEHGTFDKVEWDNLSKLGITREQVSDAYLQSLAFGAEQIKQLM